MDPWGELARMGFLLQILKKEIEKRLVKQPKKENMSNTREQHRDRHGPNYTFSVKEYDNMRIIRTQQRRNA